MRRFISTIFYILGGAILNGELMLSFWANPDGLKFVMSAILISMAGILIAIGAIISPAPSRSTEAGLVVLITTGFSMFGVGMMIYMSIMPDTRALMLPETLDKISDYGFGSINLGVVCAIGALLFRWRDRALMTR